MMKKHNDQSLETLQKYLLDLANNATERVPLSEEEISILLEGYANEDITDELYNETILAAMRAAHEQRVKIEKKLSNTASIHSLAELLKVISFVRDVSAEQLARLLGLSIKEYNAHANGEKRPEEMGEHCLLTIASLIELSFNEFIQILEKTIQRLKIKGGTRLAAGQARADKSLSESTRDGVMLDAMTELLLKTEKTEDIGEETALWNEFKTRLHNMAEQEGSLDDAPGDCYTLPDRRFNDRYKQLIKKLEE